MAENSKLTGIELNGVLYSLGKSIYEELGISIVRFAELLGRDFYCPTLSSAPTASTLKYMDTDGEEQTFQVGQPCRWKENEAWRIAVCLNNTDTYSEWYFLPTDFISEEALENKQDKILKYESKVADLWRNDDTYMDYTYRCDVPCEGVSEKDIAQVIFSLPQATSGQYAPVCETGNGVVSIWSAGNTEITIPLIIIIK